MLSKEQESIMNAICEGNSVIVEAVPGSGKTTLVLELAKRVRLQIMQITYSSPLKEEVREKMIEHNIRNMDVHSYHSLANKFYIQTHEDIVIQKIIDDNIDMRYTKHVPGIFVIDETQDMTFLYYQLIYKFVNDYYTSPPIFLILGDRQQSIYKFKGADERFITLADKIWKDVKFIKMPLTVSFRLTNQISKFLSSIAIREINTVRDGPAVKYVCCENPIPFVMDLCSQFSPGEIFILAPSITNKNVTDLEHELVHNNVLCYIKNREQSSLYKKTSKNKLVFDTLHASKGRERKCVIVYDFDNSYFMRLKDEEDRITTKCNNAHYVALSRATHLLVLITGQKSMPYITQQTLEDMEIINDREILFHTKIPKATSTYERKVTDLIKYIKDKYLHFLNIPYTITPLTNEMEIQSTVEFVNEDGTVYNEEVSAFIGIAVAAAWEYRNTGKITICANTEFMKQNELDIIQAAVRHYSETENTISCIKQILHYNWFTREIYDHCMENMDRHIRHPKHFEYRRTLHISDWNGFNVRIKGAIDCVCDDTVWEFKCVANLEHGHLMQIFVYAVMMELHDMKFAELPDKIIPKYKYKLFNIRTGEIWELRLENIKETMGTIFTNAFTTDKISDEEFVDKCISYRYTEPKINYDKYEFSYLQTLCRNKGCTNLSVMDRRDMIAYLHM